MRQIIHPRGRLSEAETWAREREAVTRRQAGGLTWGAWFASRLPFWAALLAGALIIIHLITGA